MILLGLPGKCLSQNIGINIINPQAKLHISGSSDTCQLLVDAFNTQNNSHPLIKLRNSSGVELLRIHSDDSTNIFIGQLAGLSNMAGSNGGIANTFIGSGSGYANLSGYWNTSTGWNALRSNSTAFNNTAFGSSALFANIDGFTNTALGSSALHSNTGGIENTAVGAYTLYSNSSGRSNTAIGRNALNANTTGNNNMADGYYALSRNTTGGKNTAAGYNALFYNTTGNDNTATGMNTLYNNPSGTGNTANGYGAGYLDNGNTGNQNTGVGAYCMLNILTSSYNTVLGDGAGSGSAFYMGWNNTLIGANTEANAANAYNSIAIGESALSTASNQARFGNSSTTSIGGYVSWTNISDRRVKKNIKHNVPGLAFINKLNTLTYNLDLAAADSITLVQKHKDSSGNVLPAMPFETDARRQKEQIVYSGFIAQDVEKAAKEIGYDFSGVDAPAKDTGLYGIRYTEFGSTPGKSSPGALETTR